MQINPNCRIKNNNNLILQSCSFDQFFILKLSKLEVKSEFSGKLNFYLEALDRDVKKEHENPSIGVLLCKGKDDTVVEYALARNLSPAVIADYETKLPDKTLLEAKLEEFTQLLDAGILRNKKSN